MLSPIKTTQVIILVTPRAINNLQPQEDTCIARWGESRTIYKGHSMVIILAVNPTDDAI